MTRSQQSLPGDKPIWRGLRRSYQNCELTEIIIYKRLDFLIFYASLILGCRKNRASSDSIGVLIHKNLKSSSNSYFCKVGVLIFLNFDSLFSEKKLKKL